MYNHYDENVLKKLQQTETQMLKRFDEVCSKYNIVYFVNFGTAIGAVRHGGFIPWDDDIDIGMIREEYEKLKKVPAAEWGDLLFVDPEDDVVYHRAVTSRLYKKDTVFETRKHMLYDKVRNNIHDEKIPIWLDIWVYDAIDSPERVKKIAPVMFRLQRLYFYAKCGVNVVKGDSLQFKCRCFVKDIMHKVMNLLPRPELLIYKKYLKKATSYPGKYYTCFAFDYIEEMIKLTYEYDDMFPVKSIGFENFPVSIQGNYEEMLEGLYGDYMKLPPEKDRFNHPPAILDFGDGKNVIDVV